MPASGSTACPDEDQLLAFVEGRLSGEPRDSLVGHIADCDHCLSAVGALGDTSDFGHHSARPVTSFQQGEQVGGRYQIKRFIARGGMGEVYEADDSLLGVRVALKTVLPSNEASTRAIELIRREVQVARAINHPGVCRVFDLGEHVPTGGEARRFFLTMEYLDGVTLGQQIRSNGALPADRLLAIARQLADGLVAAHEAGVVHRDFKSDNVMLMAGSQGGTPRAVIMDFGLARGGPLGIGMASTGGIMVGSAAYMAPEQVQGGPVRQGADIYAFGVVLYEAATGALPFVGTTAIATATKRLMEKPLPPRSRIPELDQRLEDLILRCLAFMPEDRYLTMAEARVALAAIDLEPRPAVAAVAVAAPGISEASAGLSRRRVFQLGGGLIVSAALLAGIRTAMRRRRAGVADAATPGGTAAASAVDPGKGLKSDPPVAAPVPQPEPVVPAGAETPQPVQMPVPQPAPHILAESAPTASPVRPTRASARPARKPSAPLSPPVAPVAPPAVPDPRSRSPLDGFANPFQ